MAIGLPGAFAQTPDNQTFTQLKTQVARYVLAPDDTEALTVAGDGINNAIRQLNMRTWNWSKESQDITLSADTATYTLNKSFKAPRQATLLDTNGKAASVLGWFDPKSFSTNFPDRDESGRPGYYTAFNTRADGKVTLSVPPDSGFVTTYPTLQLDYYARAAVLVNDSDELDAPSEVENFVKWSAMSYIASVYDPSKVRHAEKESDKAWGLLVIDDNETEYTDWSGVV